MIERDKILHFLAGFFITTVMFHITMHYWASFLVACGFAVGKEVYDRYIKKGNFDPVDMAVTVVGSVVYFALIRWF